MVGHVNQKRTIEQKKNRYLPKLTHRIWFSLLLFIYMRCAFPRNRNAPTSAIAQTKGHFTVVTFVKPTPENCVFPGSLVFVGVGFLVGVLFLGEHKSVR